MKSSHASKSAGSPGSHVQSEDTADIEALKEDEDDNMAIILVKAAVYGTDLWNGKLESQAGMCLGESHGLSVRSGTSNGQERTWF